MIFKNENIAAALFNVEDFSELPTSGVEDVDRAVFNLFNEKLPFFVEQNDEKTRIPVIYASGERAVLLKKRRAMRDSSGALILPVISIIKTGFQQDPPGYGLTPTDEEIIIKRRIYKDNVEYKREKNFENLQNADYTIKDTVADGSFSKRDYQQITKNANFSLRQNSNNIYEYYTMPVPRFFKCTYEVTFWCQLQTQLNDAMTALMDFYKTPARSFMLESEKGYKYTANISSDFNTDINTDSLTDAERIVRSSFTLESYGYIINAKYPGSVPAVKRYVTQPKIVFETNIGTVPDFINTTEIESNDPADYIESDWANEFDKLPGSQLGKFKIDENNEADVTIGKTNKLVSDRYILKTKDPTTGAITTEEYIIKSANTRKGEIVLRHVKVL